ncbi:phage minor head protein [Aquamicrobium soli]|uniref:Phage minor head protein n=1 Tax=Aquamicrobium soli TaxID=1811518 RepID=A0ABV7KF15_9HYPH
MTRRTDREVFEELLAKHEPLIRQAFLDAIRDLVDNITLRVVVERLERGDVAGAINALHLDADAFGRLERAIADAYNSGGQATVGNLPRLIDPSGARVVFRFGIRNPEAEAWLREHSSTLVTRIVEDQVIGIRTALTEGLSQGQNPRATALNIAGRMNRATGRREGGIIGLTAPQERYVASARDELSSSDPDQMRHYLTRGRRDKRFDKTILRAIKDGKKLDGETVTRIVSRYSDRLLGLRGEMLARTETMLALGKAKDDAIRQQIASGKIKAEDVTKIWHSAGDNRVRHTHQVLNGTSVGIDELFESLSGATLRFPHDPDGPREEIIGCRCYLEYRVDYFASVVRRAKAEAA